MGERRAKRHTQTQLGQVATHDRRTGEGHEFGDRARDEVAGDVGGNPEDEVEDSGGKAGVGKCVGDVECAGRGLLGRLENDRTTARKRAGNFAGRLAHRKVPRRERSDRPDRLVVDDVANTGCTRDDASVRANRFTGVPLEELGASDDLESGLLVGLAVLEGDRVGDLVLAQAQQACRLANQIGSVTRCGGPPDLEPLLGGLQCIVEVG